MKWNLLAFTLLLPGGVVAQNVTAPPERTVVVSATATVERDPERAELLLAVESTGATAQQATQANATRMDALVAEVRRRGITPAQVRTVSYQLTPEYARSPQTQVPERQGPPRIIGYRAANIQAGANRVAGLRFELRDPQSARLEALRLAVARARAEAEAMALAAGQRLGPPLNMNTHGPIEPRAFEVATARMADVMQAPPTPIEPGTLTITASVTITFRLDPG
jgi:uncharacterized protein YggE